MHSTVLHYIMKNADRNTLLHSMQCRSLKFSILITTNKTSILILFYFYHISISIFMIISVDFLLQFEFYSNFDYNFIFNIDLDLSFILITVAESHWTHQKIVGSKKRWMVTNIFLCLVVFLFLLLTRYDWDRFFHTG